MINKIGWSFLADGPGSCSAPALGQQWHRVGKVGVFTWTEWFAVHMVGFCTHVHCTNYYRGRGLRPWLRRLPFPPAYLPFWWLVSSFRFPIWPLFLFLPSQSFISNPSFPLSACSHWILTKSLPPASTSELQTHWCISSSGFQPHVHRRSTQAATQSYQHLGSMLIHRDRSAWDAAWRCILLDSSPRWSEWGPRVTMPGCRGRSQGYSHPTLHLSNMLSFLSTCVSLRSYLPLRFWSFIQSYVSSIQVPWTARETILIHRFACAWPTFLKCPCFWSLAW